MRLESLFERPHQRNERERNNRNGQDRMRDKNREVDRANPAQAFERHGANLIMIDEVGNQKKRRGYKSRQHTGAMGADALRLYEVISCY